MLNHKRNLLSAALASAIMMLAQGAQAQVQDDPATPVDESAETAAQRRAREREEAKSLDAIEVTGIRAGIETAIEVKKDNTSIVDVVSSEDLGKLPDISIADSIARLPGLASQRVAGRSSTISIRGLSGDYGTTLLNGREQVSVGDNRTVEFDQFPSELINQVVVYKTPDASLVGQGLSCTFDLRTVRPLAFLERTVSFNVRGEKNSLGELNSDSDDFGSRVSAFYVDQFDDRIGIALGYARLDSPGQAQRWEAWGFPDNIAPAPAGTFTLGGGKVIASSTDNVRQGLMGVLEFNASDTYTTILDVYYSKFEKAETTRFLETGLGWGGGVTLSNPVVEDGVTVSGRFNNVRPVLRNDLNEGDDKLFAIGWNNRWDFSDYWTGELDISHSQADRNESILEMYAGTRAGQTDTVDFVLDPTGFPTFTYGRNYADPSVVVLTDPGGWGQDGYIKTPQIEDELTSFRAGLERQFDDLMFSSVEFGVNFADREKTRSVPEAFLDLITDETTIPSGLLLDPVDLSFAGVPGSISYNINDALAQFYRLRNNINADIVNKQWTVSEEVTTAYAQLNLDTQWGSVPVRGNLGVQAVGVDQSSDGFIVLQGNAAAAIPYSGGADYTDYLPSLNLAFELPSDNTVRLGLGKQMARPRIDQMRANNNTSLEFTGVNQGLWIRSGGNPELQPWEANALDVSWEKYFGGRGYVALAYFYKDLKTYVFDQQGFFDATGLPIPTGYTGPTPQTEGFYTRPANGEGGTLKGWEFSVSIPFDMFSEALEGFGVVANYSDTNSGIKRNGPDGPDEPIAGLSDVVRNIAVYYENHGFSARVSQRHRSEFLGEIQGFGADRALVNIDGESVIDTQLGYSFADGSALEGVSVLLQVNNATNEPYRQFFLGNELTQKFEEYGRQYLLGVTYKF
jgi:iron complex outermembrane receptor protein